MHFTSTKSSPQIQLLLEDKTMFSSPRGFLAIAMYHQRETIKSNQHTMMVQRKGLATTSLATVGPAKDRQ